MKYTIFSLGNPGAQYEYTRHNAARLACEESRFEAAAYVVPDCYMNESGKFIKQYLKYNNNVIPVIVYDDIDLEFGKVKCKFGGSNGGHNGLKSIDQKLGQDYYRIRIGIGRPTHCSSNIANYVLTDFSDTELVVLYKKYEIILKNLHLLLSSELENFKTQISKNM